MLCALNVTCDFNCSYAVKWIIHALHLFQKKWQVSMGFWMFHFVKKETVSNQHRTRMATLARSPCYKQVKSEEKFEYSKDIRNSFNRSYYIMILYWLEFHQIQSHITKIRLLYVPLIQGHILLHHQIHLKDK